MKKLDLKMICRVCQGPLNSKVSILESYDQHKKVYELIMECARVQIDPTGNLPMNICLKCKIKLTISYTFKMQCESTDEYLRSYLLSNVHVKDEPIISDTSTSSECSVCKRLFSNVDHLKTHSRIHKNSRAYECKKCQKKFAQKKTLDKHTPLHNPHDVWKCNICEKKYVNLVGFKRHVKTHIHAPFLCKNCDAKLESSTSVIEHLNDCPEFYIYCRKCTRDFDNVTTFLNEDAHCLCRKEVEGNSSVYTSILEDSEDLNVVEDSEYTDDELNERINGNNNCSSPLPERFSDENDSHDFSKPLKKSKVSKSMPEIKLESMPGISVMKMEKDITTELFRCPRCKRMTNDRQKYIAHLKTHSIQFNSLIKCSCCSWFFENEEQLKLHENRSVSEKIFDEFFENKPVRNLVKRKKKKPVRGNKLNSTVKFKTNDGNETAEFPVNTKEISIMEIKNKTKMLVLPDPTCLPPEEQTSVELMKELLNSDRPASKLKSTAPRKKLKQKKTKKKNAEKRFTCCVCGETFNDRSYWHAHEETHSGLNKFQCKYCHIEFSWRSQYVSHMRTHNQSERKYLCTECGKRFMNNYSLTVHIRRHKGEKGFKCRYCDKAFVRAADKKTHELYHTGEKQHLCIVCGRGFARSYGLTLHMRTHTGERPYQCEYCPNAFAQRNDYKAHVRRHTGERFRCDVCNEAFLMHYLLNKHKRKAHNIYVESVNGRMKPWERVNVPKIEKVNDDEATDIDGPSVRVSGDAATTEN